MQSLPKKECVNASANISNYSQCLVEGSSAMEVYKVTWFCCEKRERCHKMNAKISSKKSSVVFQFWPKKREDVFY